MDKTATMEPSVGAIRRIDRLVGLWGIVMTMQNLDGGTFTMSGKFEAKAISLGKGVHSVLRVDLPGQGPYEENVLWSFDDKSKKIRQLNITSDGRTLYNVGRWTDDNTIELEWMEGQEEAATEHIKISMVSPDEVRGHIIVGVGGRTRTLIDYILRRK